MASPVEAKMLNRQTDRQRDRQTDREIDRQTDSRVLGGLERPSLLLLLSWHLCM